MKERVASERHATHDEGSEETKSQEINVITVRPRFIVRYNIT